MRWCSTPGGRGNDPLPRVGLLAARHLEATLGVGDALAISWGTAVCAVADGLDPGVPRDVEVVQMLGGAGSRNSDVDGTELARRMAELLGGHCRYLNVPLFVDDQATATATATATALRRQRAVRETLSAAEHADLAVVGIGALVPAVSSLLRAGHLTRRGITELRRAGTFWSPTTPPPAPYSPARHNSRPAGRCARDELGRERPGTPPAMAGRQSQTLSVRCQ